jgi:hypothetical protein
MPHLTGAPAEESPADPAAGGSVISVPPLPSDAKSSVAWKSSKVMLAELVPSVTVSRPRPAAPG